jgi:hypothetical protein
MCARPTPPPELVTATATCFTVGVRLLLLCLALVTPAAPAAPSAVDVARRYADAIVRVVRPCSKTAPTCTPIVAQGFFVSSTGMLASVLPGVVRGDLVEVDDGVATRRARVDAVDADGLALLQLEPGPDTPVTALAVASRMAGGPWLIGLHRNERGVQAVVGGAERDARVLLPVPRGAPILDERLQVVAIARRSRGGGSTDTLPVDRLQALASRAADVAVAGPP